MLRSLLLFVVLVVAATRASHGTLSLREVATANKVIDSWSNSDDVPHSMASLTWNASTHASDVAEPDMLVVEQIGVLTEPNIVLNAASYDRSDPLAPVWHHSSLTLGTGRAPRVAANTIGAADDADAYADTVFVTAATSSAGADHIDVHLVRASSPGVAAPTLVDTNSWLPGFEYDQALLALSSAGAQPLHWLAYTCTLTDGHAGPHGNVTVGDDDSMFSFILQVQNPEIPASTCTFSAAGHDDLTTAVPRPADSANPGEYTLAVTPPPTLPQYNFLLLNGTVVDEQGLPVTDVLVACDFCVALDKPNFARCFDRTNSDGEFRIFGGSFDIELTNTTSGSCALVGPNNVHLKRRVDNVEIEWDAVLNDDGVPSLTVPLKTETFEIHLDTRYLGDELAWKRDVAKRVLDAAPATATEWREKSKKRSTGALADDDSELAHFAISAIDVATFRPAWREAAEAAGRPTGAAGVVVYAYSYSDPRLQFIDVNGAPLGDAMRLFTFDDGTLYAPSRVQGQHWIHMHDLRVLETREGLALLLSTEQVSTSEPNRYIDELVLLGHAGSMVTMHPTRVWSSSAFTLRGRGRMAVSADGTVVCVTAFDSTYAEPWNNALTASTYTLAGFRLAKWSVNRSPFFDLYTRDDPAWDAYFRDDVVPSLALLDVTVVAAPERTWLFEYNYPAHPTPSTNEYSVDNTNPIVVLNRFSFEGHALGDEVVVNDDGVEGFLSVSGEIVTVGALANSTTAEVVVTSYVADPPSQGVSTVDCRGVINGNTVVDECGVCGGNGQSCCTDYLGLDNRMWDWLILQRAIDEQIRQLNELKASIECTEAIHPRYDQTCRPPDGYSKETIDEQLAALSPRTIDTAEDAFEWNDCLVDYTGLVDKWNCQINPTPCEPPVDPCAE